MILDNCHITVREVADDVRLIPRKFYGCFTHETCDSGDCSKDTKFWEKTTSHGHQLARLAATIRICSKRSTNHGCMSTTLKPKPNHPNGIIQKSQDRKKHVMFGQMWRFCSLFSLITMTWPIMVNNEYYLELMRRNNISTTVLNVLGSCWLFPLPKTEDTVERIAFCYDWGDKKNRNSSC